MKNLLNIASSVVKCRQTVQYLRYLGTSINEMGRIVPSYYAPIVIKNAYVQPMDLRSQQMVERLDVQPIRNLRTVYLPIEALSTEEQTTSDIIIYRNRRWQIVASDNWYDYDGWMKLIIAEEK